MGIPPGRVWKIEAAMGVLGVVLMLLIPPIPLIPRVLHSERC